jgi:transposase
MTVITMSRNELTRLRALIDIADGRLSVADATGLLGVGRRQVYRLLDAFRTSGPDGLISRKRGRPTLVCSRSAEPFYEPSELALAR